MFTRALRFLSKWKPVVATSLLTLGYGLKKVAFDNEKLTNIESPVLKTIQKSKTLSKMIQKEVCESKSIREGELYYVSVTDEPQDGSQPRTYKIVISRVKGKLYAVLAHCTYKQPLGEDTVQTNSLQDAIIFNQKLYCPHHGCAFDIRSGSVQYGPARQNLPRFYVQQKQNKVRISYPASIPTSVTPKNQFRDLNDLRKVVVVGGDHSATLGVIDGLKQYEYGGQFTIISTDDQSNYPYHHELLHRKLINLNKNLGKDKYWKSQEIQKQLQEKIYSKLNFFDDAWYEAYGINFIFNPEMFRIVNKRFYPYIKFIQGTKIQFDGLIYAAGFKPRFPVFKNIVSAQVQEQKNKLNLPVNVFAPHYNKKQHTRLLKYLNGNNTQNMIVLGLNIESLEFVEAMRKEFPKVNVKVMDINNDSTLTQTYGPDITKEILQEYVRNGVQFYIKITNIPTFSNSLFKNWPITNSDGVHVPNFRDSITVKLDQNESISADCVVLFPNNTYAKTQDLKSAKYVDIDYRSENGRVIVNTQGRTDTKRIFAAGNCASQDYYFTRSKIQTTNPNVSYQQGIASAFNMSALNVPFAYIPFETHKFFNKKILYAGPREAFNQMFIIGEVDKWDFLTLYGLDDEIIAVSATPSRQKQFQVIREAFRLQCQPHLKQIVSGQWKISEIYLLIRKLNKSGCYRDLVRTLHPELNIPDVIWMDRQRGSFVSQEDDDDRNVEIDYRGYETQSN